MSYIAPVDRGGVEVIKKLADKAIEQLSDEQLRVAIDPDANSAAVIMRHMAGNMRSRWVDFMTSDGEKPSRMRDQEFEDPAQTRAELMAEWEHGWQCVFTALTPLTDADLQRSGLIRVEVQPHRLPLVDREHHPAAAEPRRRHRRRIVLHPAQRKRAQARRK